MHAEGCGQEGLCEASRTDLVAEQTLDSLAAWRVMQDEQQKQVHHGVASCNLLTVHRLHGGTRGLWVNSNIFFSISFRN